MSKVRQHTTTFQLAPILNGLYKMGFNSAHFPILENTFKTIFTTTDDDIHGNEISSITKSNEYVIETHPNTKNIQIYKLEGEDLEFVNKHLTNHQTFFALRPPKSLKTQGTISTELIIFQDLVTDPIYKSNLVTIRSLADIDIIPTFIQDTSPVFTNPSDFISKLSAYILSKPELLHSIKNIAYSKEDIQALMSAIFYKGKRTTGTVRDAQFLTESHKFSRQHLFCILDVWEQNNVRGYTAITRVQRYWNTNSVIAVAGLMSHTDKDYDYVDVDRYFLRSSSITDKSRDNYYRGRGYEENVATATDSGILGDIVFSNIPIKFPTTDVIEHNFRNTSTLERYIDQSVLDFMGRRYAQLVAQNKIDQENAKIMSNKIKSKVLELKLPETEIKLNDVIYRHDNIEYQNQKLSIDGVPHWVHEVMTLMLRSYEWQDLNFEIAQHSFVDYLIHGFKRNTTQTFTGAVGDVTYKLEQIATKDKQGYYTQRYKINNHRINKEELGECILKGLCFVKQKDYDSFLESISKCSLKVHGYLHNGVDIDVFDTFDTNNKITLRLHLEREKNHNYLSFKTKKFKVTNSAKLFSLQNKSSLLQIFNMLLDGKTVEGVTEGDLEPMILEARTAYQDAIDKNAQLLKDTETMFNLTPVTDVQLDNGITVGQAYIIKGKLAEYCLDRNEKNNVYKYPEGKYICMVDKSNNAAMGHDRLVNRIFALHNDKLVSEEISTINFT